jgi:imidazolonepropionase-like amidohydrolase
MRLFRLLTKFLGTFGPRHGRRDRLHQQNVPSLPAPGFSDNRSHTIRVGWLIDGSGGEIRRDARIEFQNGIIRSISVMPGTFMNGSAPLLASRSLEFAECTMLPGLVDAHVHLDLTGSVDERLRTRLRTASFDTIQRLIAENLREHLRHGVVAVRDGGGARGNALRFSRGSRGRSVQPVRVLAAGRAWHRQGRYGKLIGRAPFNGCSLADSILRDGDGGDLVKIINSGLNSLTEYARQTAPQFDLDELSAAVRIAAEQGRGVMVHANGETPVRIAVLSGCRSVEHGFFMGAANLELLAERGVVWVPTAVTMQAYAGHFAQSGRNPDVAGRTLDHQLEQLSRARGLGVTVALGTDSGSPGVEHGAAVIAEMKLLMQAGFSLGEAVRCAAVNGARLIGAEHGPVQTGKPATFIIVEGEPCKLSESLKNVKAVYVSGVRQFEAG